MLQDDDYDSDTSDEDFVPEGVESEDEPLSDVVEENNDEDEEGGDAQGKKKKKKSCKKKKKENPLLAQLHHSDEEKIDKEEPADPEKDKEKADNLWADFLADVEDKPSPPPKPKSSSWASLLGNKKKPNSSNAVPVKPLASFNKSEGKKKEEVTNKTVKITKVFEFAGEEVRVEKEVDANSEEAKAAANAPPPSTTTAAEGKNNPIGSMKRPGGLSSILGQLDSKKQKLTTLEKTKLDWNNFKSQEGIDEELESHKKSKDGYLDKKAFLERADIRQFEIERAMRMKNRSNR